MLTFRFYHTYKYDLLLISICYISSQNVVIYTVLFMLGELLQIWSYDKHNYNIAQYIVPINERLLTRKKRKF